MPSKPAGKHAQPRAAMAPSILLHDAAGSILAAPPAPVLSVIVQKAGGAAAPSLIMIGELTLALAAAGNLLGDGGCCKMLKAWQANTMDATLIQHAMHRQVAVWMRSP